MRIQKLFADEVLLPELQSLLTLLLQKFQREWHEEVIKDKFQNDAQSQSGEMEVKFRLARVQRYSRYHAEGEISNTQLPQETNTV
ncbi:hypothetical protein ACOSP7_027835 [Xanthoceras sorbifolium]